jgi:hypothetical protein
MSFKFTNNPMSYQITLFIFSGSFRPFHLYGINQETTLRNQWLMDCLSSDLLVNNKANMMIDKITSE